MRSYDGIRFYMRDDIEQTAYFITEIDDEYYQVTWGKTFVITISKEEAERHFQQGYWIEVVTPKDMLKERLKG